MLTNKWIWFGIGILFAMFILPMLTGMFSRKTK